MRFRASVMLVLAGGAVISSLPAHADVTSEIQVCKALTDSLSRLTCYDRLAAGISEETPEASDKTDHDSATAANLSDTGSDQWMVDRKTSPIDDSQTILLSKYNQEWIADPRLGRDLSSLIIRCEENETSVIVATSDFLGISDVVPVTVRFDGQPAQRQTWNGSTSNRSAFAPQPIKFIRQLLETDQLAVRLEKHDGSDITITFTLAGLKDAIGDVQAACHWQ